MKNHWKQVITLMLSLTLMLAAMPVSAGADVLSFPDAPTDAWYRPYLDKIMKAQAAVGVNNIISGMYNDKENERAYNPAYPDDTLLFNPNLSVARGEFLKMLLEATESSGSQTAILPADAVKPGDHWAEKYYLKAKADNILVADVYSNTAPMFSGSREDLDTPITRYEMAVILNNVCTNTAMQKTAVVDTPENHITDYDVIPAAYKTAVEQAYGKGLLTGNENGYFNGADTLDRAQAVTVIYRYLFLDTIQGEGLQDWASYPKAQTASGGQLLDPSLSFANWLRNGHVDSWGNIDAEAKIKLFGSANKSYFSSSYDASAYMTTVSVPVWTMDKAGNKIASTCPVTVNKAVAEEVKSIFQMIFDDPEQFPIYGGWSAGGARYTDTMRHSWGCAIDINAYYNCECNTKSGYLKVTCGYGWWPQLKDTNNRPYGASPNTAFAGTMTNASPYSIGKNPGEYGYSVVKAFSTYGWGWGGNGWSGGKSFDYMHFSVLPSGG